ncbi:putative ABC transporter permease [Pseudomonas phage HU1]|nr:putative ABC transporter permease [Pseudomonas phage HU1]
MTTKTEETRHAMYQHLEGVKKTLKKGFSPRAKMSDFESALEEHLEALRQELAFSKLQLMTCRQTNMDIQSRLHAVDHAHFVQSQANLAAGDQLRDAQALIQRQRGAIADMYMAGRAVKS